MKLHLLTRLLLLLAGQSCLGCSAFAPPPALPAFSATDQGEIRGRMVYGEQNARGKLADSKRSADPVEEEQWSKLRETSHEWFFGQGFGTSALNVALIVAFPPYALYLLGNEGLKLAGFKPLYVSNALPDPVREPVMGAYDGVTSAPGKANAAVFGEKFVEEALNSTEAGR